MSLTKKLVTVLAVAMTMVASMLVIGCSGDDGAKGTDGTPGTPGTPGASALGKITGTTQFSNGVAATAANRVVVEAKYMGPGIVPGTRVTKAAVTRAGEFTISVPPGQYEVRAIVTSADGKTGVYDTIDGTTGAAPAKWVTVKLQEETKLATALKVPTTVDPIAGSFKGGLLFDPTFGWKISNDAATFAQYDFQLPKGIDAAVTTITNGLKAVTIDSNVRVDVNYLKTDGSTLGGGVVNVLLAPAAGTAKYPTLTVGTVGVVDIMMPAPAAAVAGPPAVLADNAQTIRVKVKGNAGTPDGHWVYGAADSVALVQSTGAVAPSNPGAW